MTRECLQRAYKGVGDVLDHQNASFTPTRPICVLLFLVLGADSEQQLEAGETEAPSPGYDPKSISTSLEYAE